jgi:hypothetical protein
MQSGNLLEKSEKKKVISGKNENNGREVVYPERDGEDTLGAKKLVGLSFKGSCSPTLSPSSFYNLWFPSVSSLDLLPRVSRSFTWIASPLLHLHPSTYTPTPAPTYT